MLPKIFFIIFRIQSFTLQFPESFVLIFHCRSKQLLSENHCNSKAGKKETGSTSRNLKPSKHLRSITTATAVKRYSIIS